MNTLTRLAALVCAMALASCGGGGPESAATPATTTNLSATGGLTGGQTGEAGTQAVASSGAAGPNALPVYIDRGPGIFLFTGQRDVNMLFTNLRLCTPGSTTECETIDHVVVDTGSVGLRVLKDALRGAATFTQVVDPVSGSPLRECAQFADGYSWGSVKTADVEIGGRRISALPLQVIADPDAGSAPARTCANGRAKMDVASFGANAIIGVGSFRKDCGSNCSDLLLSGWYHICPNAGSGALCKPIRLSPDHQLPNPIAQLSGDNNGITIDLPAVAPEGAQYATGTLYFGLNTQDDNQLESRSLFTVDEIGALTTTYAGTRQRAIIDTGTNAYVFGSDIALCKKNAAFYCPTANGVPTSLPQTALIAGMNGASRIVNFTVDSADQYPGMTSVMPGLATPGAALVGGWNTIVGWGLPFFLGRRVQVLFEGSSLDGVTGPAVAF